jgi:hypothetical protein
VLGRAGYTTAQEQQAEMLASVIRARAARGLPGAPGADAGRGALGRLSDVLTFNPDGP